MQSNTVYVRALFEAGPEPVTMSFPPSLDASETENTYLLTRWHEKVLRVLMDGCPTTEWNPPTSFAPNSFAEYLAFEGEKEKRLGQFYAWMHGGCGEVWREKLHAWRRGISWRMI